MLTKSILKIWLLSVNFEIHLHKLMEGAITALQSLDGDWSVQKFIGVNFAKLTDNNQIFWNDFDCIHHHFCKLSSEIIECKIFAPYDFLEMNSISTYTLWFHSDPRQRVVVDCAKSDWIPIISDVQGSVLGRHLSILYTSEMRTKEN